MRLTIITCFFLVTCISLRGQQLLRGMVADSSSFTPLPYITVELKNRSKGTITDNDGVFKIVAAETDTLVFRSVEYNTVEIPAWGWDNNLVLLSEKVTLLRTVTITDSARGPGYEEMFEEQNAIWDKNNKRLPFYFSRSKKQKIKMGRLDAENLRVKTYVDVVITNDENRNRLMKTYELTEAEYYDILGQFNASNYRVMYYLSAPELITLLNNYFAAHHRR